MAELLKIARDDSLPVAAGLQAIRDGLDRAGTTQARAELELTVKPWQGIIDSIIVDQDAAPQPPVNVGPDEDPDIVDAEVITDEFEGPTPAPENVRVLPTDRDRPPNPTAKPPRWLRDELRRAGR